MNTPRAGRVHPLEELETALASFAEQGDHFALLLTTRDGEVPIVVRTLDGLDEASPSDVYFIDATPVTGVAAYVETVIGNVAAQIAEVNEERLASALPPLAPVPYALADRRLDPLQRLRALLVHMASWLPPADDHRLVIALLPSSITDAAAHSQIVGALVPFHGYEPWMRGVRLILRDDGGAPFVAAALRKAGARSVLLYTTRVNVSDLADAVADDAANPAVPEVQRINALLQCAALDVALGRLQPAIEKYGTLFAYYDRHGVLEMKAVVVQGVGDVLMRLDDLRGARDKFLQALDLAADAKSVPLILNATTAIGDVDMRLSAHDEAAYSYGLAAEAAEKLGNGFARADLLEKRGSAEAARGASREAVTAWTASATVARESAYDERLVSVLSRLRDVSARAGHRDLRDLYDAELREAQLRAPAR